MNLPLPKTPDPGNPLYRPEGLPAFDRIAAEHVEPAITRMLEECEAAFAQAEADVLPTWESAVEHLDALERPLGHAWGIVMHLHGVRSSTPLREAIERCQPAMVAYSLRTGQSRPVYDALQALLSSGSLSPAQERTVRQRVLSAKHAGVALEGEARERFNAIAAELAQLSLSFSNHVLDATQAAHWDWTDPADVEGLPRPLRVQLAAAWMRAHPGETATAEEGPWRMTLERSILAPFLQQCPDRAKREMIWRAYGRLATEGEQDNRPLVSAILRLRQEKATLLGYATWAELSTATKMATVPQIDALLRDLKEAAMPAARKELAALEERAQAACAPLPLAPWDVAFWQEREREARFGYTDEELRAYFQEPRVLEGLFGVLERIFGVRVEDATEEVPRWEENVRFYRVLDIETDALLAGFYLDPYSRPADKRPGAWMDECLSRRAGPDGVTLPVAYLVCNATPPAEGRPAQMSFDEVLTLFHEFGHGLQHMLTQVDLEPVSGIRGVEWDAVELPSQFMENWCYHEPTVRGMTAHVETGEPMPSELFAKVLASRTFGGGLGTLRQLMLGLSDLRLHDGFVPEDDESPHTLQREVERQTSVLPVVEDRWQLCSFSHIFAGGYAAGYYSYKWAEVLSADAFGAFEEVGLDNEDEVAVVGRKFRDTVLGLGGALHPSEVYRAFRGRDATVDALLRQYGFERAA